jgi:regulation of enolase protein 1 (concanavalin A-like superfamily)
VEFTDDATYLSVVVTNDSSDWSVTKSKIDERGIRIRLTRHEEAARVQYLDWDTDQWTMIRLGYLPKSHSIDLGVMCCSPEREGFEVVFSDFMVGSSIARQLHHAQAVS